MELFEGEVKLIEAGSTLTLTTHRVCLHRKHRGHVEFTTLPLDAITSTRFDKQSHPSYAIAGVLLAGASVVWATMTQQPTVLILGAIALLTGLIAYGTTRRDVLVIASPTDDIRGSADTTESQTLRFLARVAQAKAMVSGYGQRRIGAAVSES